MKKIINKERGPGPLRMSFYIILFLFITAVLFFTVFSPWYYGKEARVMASKTNYAQTVRYISRELGKCRLDDKSIMDNTLMCSDMNSKSLILAFLNKHETYNNPYYYPDDINAFRSSDSNTNDDDVGYVSLSASGSNIIIKTCIKTPCRKEENRLQDSMELE